MNYNRITYICPVSTRLFDYNAKDRTLSQEASTLRGNGWHTGQICNDSCDEGFTLISHRTGREMPVGHSRTETRDGELLWDEFTPVKAEDRKLVAKVIIFND